MAQYTGKLTWYDPKKAAGGVERDEDKAPYRFFAKTDEEKAELEAMEIGSAIEFDLEDTSPFSMIVYAKNVHKA